MEEALRLFIRKTTTCRTYGCFLNNVSTASNAGGFAGRRRARIVGFGYWDWLLVFGIGELFAGLHFHNPQKPGGSESKPRTGLVPCLHITMQALFSRPSPFAPFFCAAEILD